MLDHEISLAAVERQYSAEYTEKLKQDAAFGINELWEFNLLEKAKIVDIDEWALRATYATNMICTHHHPVLVERLGEKIFAREEEAVVRGWVPGNPLMVANIACVATHLPPSPLRDRGMRLARQMISGWHTEKTREKYFIWIVHVAIVCTVLLGSCCLLSL